MNRLVAPLLGALLLASSAAPAHGKEKVYLDLDLDEICPKVGFLRGDLKAARQRMEQHLAGLLAQWLPAWEFVAGKEKYPRLSIAIKAPEGDADGPRVKVLLEATKGTPLQLGTVPTQLCTGPKFDALREQDVDTALEGLTKCFQEHRFEPDVPLWRKTFTKNVFVARSPTPIFREPRWALIPLPPQFGVYSWSEFEIRCRAKMAGLVILRTRGIGQWEKDCLIADISRWWRAEEAEKGFQPFLKAHLTVLTTLAVSSVSVDVYLTDLDPGAMPGTDML